MICCLVDPFLLSMPLMALNTISSTSDVSCTGSSFSSCGSLILGLGIFLGVGLGAT
jgi:hypothetical protein